MRRLILGFALLAATASQLFASVSVTVNVLDENGTGVGSASVYGVVFTTGGPDGTNSIVTATNGSGVATLSLTDNLSYEIFASKNQYSPSVRDQMNSPTHVHVLASGTLPAQNITLKSGAKGGIVTANITNASNNAVLFGRITSANDSSNDIAFGIIKMTGTSGTLSVDNVPPAAANTYAVDVFDQAKNTGMNVKVTNALADGATVGPYAMDLTGGMPPQTVQRQDQSQPTTGVSVDGVVLSTSSTPIPYVGVSFDTKSMGNVWANTDSNGRFQLFNLTNGTTYYARIMAGCNQGGCFEGYSSTCSVPSATTIGPYDFVFSSASAPMQVRVKLNRASAGTGQIEVYVKNQAGQALPRSNVSVWPDWRGWITNPLLSCSTGYLINQPGLANMNVQATTGYALISGLQSGNYQISVWSPFSSQQNMFNGGADGQFGFDWNQNACSGSPHQDDLRVFVDTSATPNLKVFDAMGNNLNLSSVTVVVNMAGGTADKTVGGTLSFPEAADLSGDPISIALQSCDQNGCHGNFYLENRSGASSYNYTMNVGVGSYWVDVQSNYWGVVRQGGGQDNVNVLAGATGVIPLNLKFARAGRVKGFLYKPDGTLFQPDNSQNYSGAEINAHGLNVEGWGHAQVDQDGSFTMGGLLPGTYELEVRGHGSFNYANPVDKLKVVITAGKDSYAEIHLVNGTYIRPMVDLNRWTPSFSLTVPAGGEPSDIPMTSYIFPAGTKISSKISSMLMHDSESNMFMYQPAGTNGPCGGQEWVGGFCANSFASPKSYDLYVFRQTNFHPGSGASTFAALVPLSSTKNVVLNDTTATKPMFIQGSTVQVLAVDMTPSAQDGEAGLSGTVIGKNIFREQDFESMGGDFENFKKFIPIITLYNKDGEFKGAGMVTPSPDQFTQAKEAQLDKSLAEGDWQSFNTLFSGLPFGFKINGLLPNTEYVQVLTTPNYPPYKKLVKTGADGSVTDMILDLDKLVGTGGTIAGSVVNTAGVGIANAAVTVKSRTIQTKTVTTDSDGKFSLPAMPRGLYRITVVAPDYVPQVKKVSLSEAETSNLTFSLQQGAGTITGTVYARKFPSSQVLVGATLVAYDDTVNGLNPQDPLYLYTVTTSSSGVYQLTGLLAGHDYRISLAVPGKYVLSLTTTAVNGTVSGVDFTLLTKPLDVEVSARLSKDNVEFLIKNPKDFMTGNAWYSLAPYDAAHRTSVDFEQLPDQKLFAKVPIASLDATKDYVLHIEATSYSGSTVTKNVPFGVGNKGHAEKQIDIALLGDESQNAQGNAGNEALMDDTGANPSGVEFPAGCMLPSANGVIPGMEFTRTDRTDEGLNNITSTVPVAGASLGSDVYQLQLDNVNTTERGFEVTLGFDPDADWSELAAYRYNPATGGWELISGVQTIDPVSGTITFDINDLNASAAPKPGVSGAPRAAGAMRAQFNGQRHMALGAPATGSSSFAIMKVPSVNGVAYAGTSFKVFNFPNPFNLKAKAVPIVHGGSTTNLDTNGTIIKYEVPSTVSGGDVVIRIYTLSGELVREIYEGNKPGGFYYYTSWDGKNKDGAEVANGVYYGVISMPGVKVKDARFKLAVIK